MEQPQGLSLGTGTKVDLESSRRLTVVAGVLLIVLSVGLILTVLEMGFRGVRYMMRGPGSRPTVSDPELGWVHNTKAGLVQRSNSCGEEVITRPPSDPYIVKFPRNTGGVRLLVLGDSTTHGHEVSTGAAFYDVLETLSQDRFSVWAAGVGGYGNWQEFVLLRKIYETVRPEVMIWQLDSNDVTDNVYELDKASFSSSMRPRPYLDPQTGDVTTHNPAPLLFDISQGARFLLAGVTGLDIRYDLALIKTAESWLSPPSEDRGRLVQQGLQVLEYVLREARRLYPDTRIIGLSLNESDDAAFATIFKANGADYWPNFTALVRASSGRPTQCLPWDRHWNHEGNRVAGKLMWDLLDGKAVPH